MKVATERLQRLRKSISIKGCENLGKLYILSFLLLSASRLFKNYFCVCQVQHCDQCQKTKRKFDHPAEELHPVPVPNSSWKQIGIDLIGPLPTTTHGNKYVIVVTDYFSKWPEARASPTKEAINVAEFLNDLILRHGCPDEQYLIKGLSFVIRYVHMHIIKQM